ncbi:hypothetical protein SCHPADRAFT_908052 [Schizopora paradoxa]|uniref:Uncharacterized protein n=1 Tax=Schizopora paradoxa TaxID=27342 RepID=A0A0H2RI53_9AGAM|nr:hypothetical protein SCHPADRAFT_908052 [Schizopora paradoxa]
MLSRQNVAKHRTAGSGSSSHGSASHAKLSKPHAPIARDTHYEQELHPTLRAPAPPRTWSNESIAGSTISTATTSAGMSSAAAHERAKAATAHHHERRKMESISDSPALLVRPTEAQLVARDLHKREGRAMRDPSPEEQARINRSHADHHLHGGRSRQSRRWKRRDDRVGFIDERHTLDDYKATLRSECRATF